MHLIRRAPLLFALVLLRTCIAHVSTEEEGGGAAPVRHLSGFMKILENMFSPENVHESPSD